MLLFTINSHEYVQIFWVRGPIGVAVHMVNSLKLHGAVALIRSRSTLVTPRNAKNSKFKIFRSHPHLRTLPKFPPVDTGRVWNFRPTPPLPDASENVCLYCSQVFDLQFYSICRWRILLWCPWLLSWLRPHRFPLLLACSVNSAEYHASPCGSQWFSRPPNPRSEDFLWLRS